MAQVWQLAEKLDDDVVIMVQNNGRVDLRIYANDLSQQQVKRIAQHLLEASGDSVSEAVAKVWGTDV